MSMLKVSLFMQLSKEERIRIEVLLQQGLSYSAIAHQLSRSVSTISREVKRNKGSFYRAHQAQAKTLRRHRQKRKHTVFDERMKRFIQHRLQVQKWSPELISWAGKKHRSDFVSTEWIYQWIWKMKFSQKSSDQPYNYLYAYL